MNRTDCPEFPHLAKEVQPLLGLFSNESTWVSHSRSWEIWCTWTWMTPLYSAVHDGEWGGVPPEVHNHLPCFERVKLVFWTLVYREKSIGESTHPWGAPVLIVRVLMWVYPASLAGDPLTDWGGHGELGQFVWEKVRHDGIEGRTEVHI